jgi:hypothetical protein
MELRPAITPHGTENITRETGGVEPDHNRLVPCPFSLHQCCMLQFIALLTEGNKLEFTMFRRKLYCVSFSIMESLSRDI